MKENNKTQAQLIKEVAELRRRIAELEASGRQRNQFEKALRTERDKAQQYLDIAEVILVALNKKGEITLINRKGNQILGYKEGELLDRDWFTTCLPSHLRKKMKSGFLKLMVGDREITEFYEKPALTKSGTERIIAWHNTLLKDAQGNNIGTLSSGEDVTERRRTEEALQESEATLRTLINAPPDSILLLDSQGVILDLNEIAAQRLGKSRDELIGTLADSSLPEAIAQRRRSIISQILGTGREVMFEDERNGIWFDTVAHPIADKDGAVGRIAIIARDITERRKAEEALRKSEDKYRNILETIEEGYYEVDLAGNFTFFNDALCRMLGYPKEELMGMNNRQYTDEVTAKKVFRTFNEVYRTGKIGKEYDYEIIKKDGTRSYVEASISLRKDLSGKAIGFRGIIRNITEQKKLQETLDKEREELKLIIDSSPIIVFYKDKDGRFIRVNKVFAKALKMTEEDFVGKTVFDLYPPKIAQDMADDDHGVLQSGKPKLNIIEQYESASGTRWAQTDKIPIFDKDGNTIGLIGFAQDITERKRAQEELQQKSQELSRLNEQLEFVLGATKTGIDIIDADFNLIYIDRQWQQVYGDPTGRKCYEYYMGREQPCPTCGIPKALETKQTVVTEEVLPRENNRIIEVHTIPFQEADGRWRVAEFNLDITERKRAEKALRESEEKYRDLVENINDIIYATDEQGIITYIAPAIEAISGYSVSELIGRSFFDFLYEEDIPFMKDKFQQDISGQAKPHEYRMVNKAGVVRWVRVFSRPSFKERRVIGVRGVMTDINERKKAEEEILSLARFPSENPNPVLRLGQDGTLLYANKASQLLLQDWGASVGSPAPPFVQKMVAQALSRQSKNMIEVACKEQVYSFVVAPIPDTGYINLYGMDVTKRKRAEEALRVSEEKYRDLVENINDIIYAIDESGIVTYVSPTIESISGYTASEIVGRSFLDFVYQEDMSDVVQFFQQDISGQAAPREYRMVAKAGDVRWARTSSRPFFEGDRIVGLRGTLTDITQSKKAEEEIKHGYEQLQETLHSTVNALAATVEMKDQYTAGHQPRVTRLSCAIAEEMGLSEDQIEGIRMAASIHDIGKIMVPAEILNKPGPLTEIQYEMIKMHPRAGYDILKGLKLPWPVARIILQHHERQDGSGYPQGLSGEEIMVEARILAVANVVEAMNAHRPYRPAYDIKEALAEISKYRGAFYDATVVDACLRLFTEKGFTLAPISR